ncbi:MAG: TrkH family potassium uptake protein [Sphaerochaetaceae bacterium]|nr:TrkH family potassium uptake protein [Sphaerochaetaceae bacterium]
MHIRKVIRLLSIIELFITGLMLFPTYVGVYYGESTAVRAFLITEAIVILINLPVVILLRKESLATISQRDGFLFTTLTWVVATAFGALPLVLSGDFTSYSKAYFEIMSGFTTTGATTLSNIEGCYKSILFWRSMTNWLGGMGIVVLFVAFLPALGAGAGSFHLMGAESVGPVKGKLTPKTKTTAILLWGIYFGFSCLQVMFLKIGGLSLYDAITVTFSTMSAAGFCVKNASIGAFNSAYVDVVVTVFMLIAGANFSLYYRAFSGHLKDSLKDSELCWYLSIFSLATLFGAVLLNVKDIYSFPNALRYMAFHVASILTTTGFSTTNYLHWPSFTIALLMLTMFIGGCAGSAGGGVKVVRISVMLKAGNQSIRQKIHPSGIYQIRDNNGPIDQKTVSSIFAFFAIYIFTWLLGAVIVSLSGADVATCLSTSILTLGNIGIGFTTIGVQESFSVLPTWTMWVYSFLMLAGRLELFTVYVLFSRAFWKR